jgi:alkanesulfonate monooxygenase SsuD/methylene tetrahydromethanopterin reductase-like flavin-dependent oxidoreductase (luciferase family)
MKVLWTEDHPQFAGEYFQVSDCGFAPKPVQKPHVPIWVGGESPAALRRAARLGDGWHSAGTSLADLPRALGILREALDAAGRRQRDFVISLFPTDRFTLDLVRGFAAQGVHQLMVPVFSFDRGRVRERLEQIATQVIEPYRRGV